MSTLQYNTRSNSNGKETSHSINSGKPFTDYHDYDKDSISQSNSVLLHNIFSHYKLKINSGKNICPFHFHNGGNETTPSFIYYKDSNSFYCFGCGSGSKSSDFVSKFENISKQDAAKKILFLFDSQTTLEIDFEEDNTDKLLINNSFSDEVFLFRTKFFDKNSCAFIENVCKAYDDFLDTHSLTTAALEKVSNLLKLKIKKYKI